MGSRLLTSNPTVTASAFVGTNPTGELITSGLPVTRAPCFELPMLTPYKPLDNCVFDLRDYNASTKPGGKQC